MTGTHLSAHAPDGVPEVAPGDDLAAAILAAFVGANALATGDVVCVTSKVVSKAEGRLVPGQDREDAITAEAVDVVARRGPTRIVRTAHGLTIAAAGVDNSNVESGTLALLPVDPDASARLLRETLRERTGLNLGVVVTDTAGRAWRQGQTDIAIGAAGVAVLDDHAGRLDAHGNVLAVTAPAVADEIAGLAELASGKLGGRPFVAVRGLAAHVLAAGDHGPGAAALVRPIAEDMFALGVRESVIRALGGDLADRPMFGAPATPDEVLDAVRRVTGLAATTRAGQVDVDGFDPRLAPLALAHGWTVDDTDRPETILRPAGP